MKVEKYRKKLITINAIQWTGNCLKDATELANKLKSKRGIAVSGNGSLLIQTLEGEIRVNKNDWIIKRASGSIYLCKPDIFDETYEKV